MEIIFVIIIVLMIVLVVGSLLLAGSMIAYYLLVIWPFTAVAAAIVIGLITESALLGIFWGAVIGVIGWGVNKAIRENNLPKTHKTIQTTGIATHTQVKESLPEIKRRRVEVEMDGAEELQIMLKELQTDYDKMVDSNDL